MPTLIEEDKFETGGTWDVSAGAPTIVSSPAPPSATRALRTDAIGEYVYWNIPATGLTRVVFGVWVRVPAFPAALGTRLFKIDQGLSEGWVNLTEVSGEPYIRSDGTPTMTSVFFGSNLVADDWHWAQIMYDVSANPWEAKLNIGGTVVTTTGAAAASNFNSSAVFLLGNTVTGEALTYYFGHAKMGIAANDSDWWDAPPNLSAGGPAPRVTMGRGTSW